MSYFKKKKDKQIKPALESINILKFISEWVQFKNKLNQYLIKK